jgi:hypothetical protein
MEILRFSCKKLSRYRSFLFSDVWVDVVQLCLFFRVIKVSYKWRFWQISVYTDDNGIILIIVIPRSSEANIFSLSLWKISCSVVHGNQFCGSVYAGVRIDSFLNTDPYWECGSRSRSMERYPDYDFSLIFCLSKRFFSFNFVSMFFVPYWFGSLDPDMEPHWNLSGSTTLL